MFRLVHTYIAIYCPFANLSNKYAINIRLDGVQYICNIKYLSFVAISLQYLQYICNICNILQYCCNMLQYIRNRMADG
jgi:hypothetical protein